MKKQIKNATDSVKRSAKRAAKAAKAAGRKIRRAMPTKRTMKKVETGIVKSALLVTVGPVMVAEWGAKALWDKVTA